MLIVRDLRLVADPQPETERKGIRTFLFSEVSRETLNGLSAMLFPFGMQIVSYEGGAESWVLRIETV